MRRATCSAVLVMATTIIAGGNARLVGVVHANTQARQAPAKPAGSGAVEACSLLMKEDAAAALGETVTGPKSTSGRPMGDGSTASACEYTGSGLHRVQLTLMQLSPGTASIYAGLCAQKGKEGLTGLGTVTCWYSDKHEELQVLKGTTFFSVELRRSGNPTEEERKKKTPVHDHQMHADKTRDGYDDAHDHGEMI